MDWMTKATLGFARQEKSKGTTGPQLFTGGDTGRAKVKQN